MVGLIVFVALKLSGCAQITDLPETPQQAFELKNTQWTDSLLVETFKAKVTLKDALPLADDALAATGFEPRPESSNAGRRCGEYGTTLTEWRMWACFYFVEDQDLDLRGRVIVQSWKSFGATTNQPWHLLLAS